MSPDSTANPAMDVDFQKMGIYIDGRTKNELDELLAAKKDARKAKAKGTAAPAKKATPAKKAPKKKKTKPTKPEYKPEDLDKDLDSYMAAAPANPEAMAA